MELILLRDVEKVGRKGEVVRVRDGFGRNFLIPRRLALHSTRANRQFIAELKVKAEKRRASEKLKAEGVQERLQQLRIELNAVAGEHGKLFGSVTAEDICEALRARGFQVDKKQIHLKEPLRSLGEHTISVELYPQLKADLVVDIVRRA